MSSRIHLREMGAVAAWIMLCVLLSGVPAAIATTGPASQPVSSAEQARLDRGQKIRRILLETLDQSYRDNGRWPEHPVVLQDERPPLVYVRPELETSGGTRDALAHAARFAAVTVTMHEPFEQNPSGVWVGYQDGHLEFAVTPQDLAAFQKQREWVVDPPAAATTQPAPTIDAYLTLKILDQDRQPVAGALVGIWGQFGADRKGPRICFRQGRNNVPAISNDRGEVVLNVTTVFQAKFSEQPTTPIFVLDEHRQLAGRVELRRDEFGQGKVREIRLSPACKVHGQISSLGLAAVGKELSWANTILFAPGQGRMYTMECTSKSADFEFPLPPGTYGLETYGTDCNSTYHYVQIEPGRRELNLQLDLPADTIVQLIGRPAPELTHVKGWKNGGLVTLAALRGKVVLLDFWGYWCGPCVASMPALMKLHDEFKDKGLVVIAVHDDSVASIAEMDQKLDAVRTESWAGWGGRDLPFLVALDGGGPMRIKYSSVTCQGATTAEYGISGYPTTILIGRDGNVIGEVEVRSPDAHEKVQKAIEAK